MAATPDPIGVTRRLAEFAARARFEDLPERVVESAKLQVLSTLGAAFAGRRTPAGEAVFEAVRRRAGAGDGECAVVGGGVRLSLRDALYTNAAFSMTLDYDDYLFAGHTGHSAVLGALAVAERLGLDGRDLLTAQVIANEAEGRIGASVLFGPLNGQLWSFLHAAGSALVYGKALGFDAGAFESALGLALLQPPRPLRTGFFGSEGKAILAAAPCVHGLDAVDLTAAGLPGAPGILDGDQGFMAAFSPRPLPGAFTGLGETWLTDTLCFKVYPGCAYIDSFVDACLEIAGHHRPDPRRIDRIDVAASILTVGMDALSKPHLRGRDSDPVTLNFSVPYNAAVALTDHELTPHQLTRERIADPRVWELAAKVHLRHDPEWTQRMQQSSVIALAGGSLEHPDFDLAGVDLSRFEMSFGATVSVILDDGRRFECAQSIPLGAAGRPRAETEALVERKFAREAAQAIATGDAQRAAAIVGALEDATPGEIRELASCLLGKP